jgi:hypothetical protein
MAKNLDRWTTKRGLKSFRGLLEVAKEEPGYLRDVEILVGSDNEEMLGLLTEKFDFASAWQTARGALAVYDGDPGGWTLIQASMRREALRRLVRFGHHDSLKAQGFGGRKKPLPYAPLMSFELSGICLALLYVIATREDACAKLLGDRLVGHLQQPDELFAPDAFEFTPFESFTALLYCRWKEVRHDAVERLLSAPPRFSLLHSDVYRQVIQSWSSPDAFHEAVKGMVELRSKWTDREDEPWSVIPCNVVPVEFLALQRIREEKGQPFQLPDHPMLQTPWAAPPKGLDQLPNDELWGRVVARCRHFVPSLVLPPNW